MKFIVQVVVIFILGFILELFLPWWSIAIAAFVGGLVFNTRSNFAAGFMAIGALWVLKALMVDINSESELPRQVAEIFRLKSTFLLLSVMFLISGLVGGFAAMLGSSLHKAKKRSYY